METIIRLRLSELTEETISRVKKILGSTAKNSDPEINIVVDLNSDDGNKYFSKLNNSIEQIKKGDSISFTMEEFTEYVKTNFSE